MPIPATDRWSVEGLDGFDIRVDAYATCGRCDQQMARRDSGLWVHVHSVNATCDPVMGQPVDIEERPPRCDLCDEERDDLNEWVERGVPRMVCDGCLVDA